MIGLGLHNYDPESSAYIQKEREILAILIPVGYWVAAIGFSFGVRLVKKDLAGELVESGHISTRRKIGFSAFAVLLGSLTVAMFVTSFAVPGQIG